MLSRLHVTLCTEDLQGVAALKSADARRDAICSVHVEQSGKHHENMQYVWQRILACYLALNGLYTLSTEKSYCLTEY